MSNTPNVPRPDHIRNADQISDDATLCIIAGSRSATDVVSDDGLQMLIDNAVAKAPFEPDAVVSGTANGVDQAGETWAQQRDLPIAQFPADWDTHGNAAGPIRNKQMAKFAAVHGDRGVLLAFIDYPSSGTESMITHAREILGDEDVFVVPLGNVGDIETRADLVPVIFR